MIKKEHSRAAGEAARGALGELRPLLDQARKGPAAAGVRDELQACVDALVKVSRRSTEGTPR